jgi:hypothetical protein
MVEMCSHSTTTTVRRRRSIGQYPTGDGETVARAFARELGVTVALAKKRLYAFPQLNDQTAAAIRAYRTAGTPAQLQRFFAPISAALAEEEFPALSIALLLMAAEADSREEVSEAAFQLCQNADTARSWVRDIDRELAALTEVRRALATRYEL